MTPLLGAVVRIQGDLNGVSGRSGLNPQFSRKEFERTVGERQREREGGKG